MNNWGNFIFNKPYIGNEIKQIHNVVLPKQYLEFMKKHNGGKGDIGETWIELFSLEELQEINDDYYIDDFLPNHIIIGSNGNGELYGIDSDGVYFNVPAIMDEDDVTVLGRLIGIRQLKSTGNPVIVIGCTLFIMLPQKNLLFY